MRPIVIPKVPAGWIEPTVDNAASITPSGTYANATYYNTTYGVKIAYMSGGTIVLSMKGGSTTSYEHLRFTLASAPGGVTLEAATSFVSTAYATAAPAEIVCCLIKGVSGHVNIAVAMSAIDATYDWTQCAITVAYV